MSILTKSSPDPADAAADPLEEFARLYDAEMPRVYRYICYRVSSVEEAEDLTADVFHRALRHWPRMRTRLRSPRAWLMTLATNRVTDHYRRRRVRRTFSLNSTVPVASAQPGPEERAVRQEEVSTLLKRLEGLPERDRTILALRFAADLSHREIGEILGISEGASAVALLRALRRLRQSYQGEAQ